MHGGQGGHGSRRAQHLNIATGGQGADSLGLPEGGEKARGMGHNVLEVMFLHVVFLIGFLWGKAFAQADHAEGQGNPAQILHIRGRAAVQR